MMDFHSTDPSFSVSWLLGLRPSKISAYPSWASQFQSNNPKFLVSRLLGLIPSPKPRKTRRRRCKVLPTVDQSQVSSEETEDEDVFGLQRLFGDLVYKDPDEEAKKEAEDQSCSESDNEPPVLGVT